MCYLSIVQMDVGPRIPEGRNRRRKTTMSIFLNRSLDVAISYAVVAIGLLTAFATVAVAV
jgi:hypothetical protein